MIPFPNKKYKIIYADPAWTYQDKAKAGDRGAESKYDTMTLDDICNLPVKQISDDDCILFIWGTWPLNREVHQVIEQWGFEYRTCGFVWEKTNPNTNTSFMGMGNWTRSNTEYCLLATKGKPKRIDASVSQLVRSPILKHSQKPDEVRKRIIKLCGDLTRIELFSRTRIDKWDTWGNDEKLLSAPLELFSNKVLNNMEVQN